ncbi:MAG: hypothetical protein JJU34_10615 [Lunatimonas sp.]|uniref:hypothetical protein n=1 Tax=Lunatimonas sp. TaxID=2060141 RepID=UPI00263B4B94|nr:hypothetical protein [Lunatimonas sp.]MCC5937724.1 hypothetical protein [Lunatimonas sp.]
MLCTSLLDTEKCESGQFKALYHHRWSEEKAYKLLKSRAELEKFSGKTARAVRQDFHVKVLAMTMCSIYAHPIEEKVRMEYRADKERKHDHKINRTHTLASFMDLLMPMFLKRKYRQAVEAFEDTVYKTREIIRPNQSERRDKKPKKPTHEL